MKLASLVAVLILAGCSTHREHAMKAPNPEAQIAGECTVSKAAKKRALAPAKLAVACKVSLAQAIETALAKVSGRALTAEIELEGGKPSIDVTIFSNGKIWEIEIDGTTGAVIEVEQEDDDDDEDDDDEDDEDDD